MSRLLLLGAGGPASTAWSTILDSLQSETDGMIIYGLDSTNPRVLIRDAGTPANNFDGDANSKLTYSSPSTKWVRNSSGVLVSGTTLRCDHTAAGVPLGLLVEGERINVCLYSDDLTNAAWTKTNMNTAYTATGPDGASNSATTCTATAGNATVLQAITSGTVNRTTSCYIKRRTGTGNIDMTIDNGVGWTPVTVTSSWTRVSPIAANPTATQTIGLRIVTSGDAVDVAFFQHEAGAFASSPIRTTSTSVTRVADDITLAVSAFPAMHTAGTVIAKYALLGNPGAGYSPFVWALAFNSGGPQRVLAYHNASNSPTAYLESAGSGMNDAHTGTVTAGTASKHGFSWATNDGAHTLDGAAVETDTSLTVSTGFTTLFVGQENAKAAGFHLNGHLSYLKFLPRAISDADLVTETTA